MTDRLPANLLALFAPRPPVKYLPPADHPPEDRRTARFNGIAAFVPALHEQATIPYTPTESWLERRDRRREEKERRQRELVSDEGVARNYRPQDDPEIRGDPYKTLFVARLPYDVRRDELEREFGRYGPLVRVRIVQDNGKRYLKADAEVDKEKDSTHTTQRKAHTGMSRGYAFVVFENESDMKAAYKATADLKIRNRKVLVDVERGRTVQGWRPRRFGGGLGGRHYTKSVPDKPQGFGPPMGPGGFRGGGFRGGFGGGERGGGFRGRGGAGGGGFRSGYGGGGRGGLGYQNGGGPPSGPRSGGGGGRGGYGGGGYGDDRSPRNANYEPLPPRGSGGYRDRDNAGGGYSSGQKRPYESGGYEESRSRRRY